MSLYGRYVLPRLTDLVMRNKADAEERARLVPHASGIVVEPGVGSALNVPFYDSRAVHKLYGVDPSRELWGIGRRRVEAAPFPVEYVPSSAEHIPLADELADTVVSTWTLCTIPDPSAALREVRRILKPDGQLLFIEHGRAPDPRVQRWQERLTPMWRHIAGGCHMDRKIDELITGAGFEFTQIARGYASGPKVLAYLFKGIARHAAS